MKRHDGSSLVQPRIVALEERLKGNAQVLVFNLFAELETELIDAVALECLVDVLLPERCDTDGVVSVHLLALLPEVLRLLDNVASEKEHGLVVLHHKGTLVMIRVLRLKQDNLSAEPLDLELLNLADSPLA